VTSSSSNHRNRRNTRVDMTLATALQEIKTHRLSIRFKNKENINFIHKLEGLSTTVLCGRPYNTASSVPSTTK
jgi:predicted nucleotide-binding protein (sugar kinase/HSP70/actin superfamily)